MIFAELEMSLELNSSKWKKKIVFFSAKKDWGDKAQVQFLIPNGSQII
jgi:hypothetical protein